MRVMTPREYARLQGVPDDYPIPLQVNQALTGFGDAVCVPLIGWIAENILNSLVTLVQGNPLCFIANFYELNILTSDKAISD